MMVEARREDRAEVDRIAKEYITRQKGWADTEYTVRHTDKRDRVGHLIVNISHRDDVALAVPGGGKSVELHIDVNARRVVQELRFQ